MSRYTWGADEVFEVDVYKMETYELTHEDNALAIAFLRNARQARKRSHHIIVHEAQRRAARLIVETADYEMSSSGTSLPATLCSFIVDFDLGTEGETVSSYHSVRCSTSDGSSCGEGRDLCNAQADVAQPRGTTASGHRWKLATSTGILRKYFQTRTRVVPESESPGVNSHEEGGTTERVPKTSCAQRKIRSTLRRSTREKHARDTCFDAVFCAAPTGAVGGHGTFECATSADFGDALVERLPSSKLSFFGKSLSGFKAVIEKGS
eukprot:TRINITY_DN6100_c1_g4_i2.p1 TRINITY_DN6100_c1_g4~~TRINITY_DN6100_c1_g4_i2.p1  ORF type:complete len:265 (+),score=22.34 TRINITY_DN6100_c1_g4_i2:59-853(+)